MTLHPQCAYAIAERAAILEFDAGLTRAEAERLAQGARLVCGVCRKKLERSKLGNIRYGYGGIGAPGGRYVYYERGKP